MNNCHFCGGPRTNGLAIKEGKHGWMIEPSPNPADPKVKMVCRSCGKEKTQ